MGSQEQAAISKKWRAGGRARDEAGGAGGAAREGGGPSLPAREYRLYPEGSH